YVSIVSILLSCSTDLLVLHSFPTRRSSDLGSLNQYLMTDNRQFHNVSGTFGILYHILPHFNWKSNIGLAWRAPSANELYSDGVQDRKSTRLNSSHVKISYAVFCLKKKNS